MFVDLLNYYSRGFNEKGMSVIGWSEAAASGVNYKVVDACRDTNSFRDLEASQLNLPYHCSVINFQ